MLLNILSIKDWNATVVKITLISIFAVLLIVVIAAIILKSKRLNKKPKTQIRNMVITSVFAALSICLYYIKFPLPFIFPEFLDIQFSLLPAIVIGLIIGTKEAIIIVLIKAIVKLPSTSTVGVGELADFLIGICTVIASSMIYNKKNTTTNSTIENKTTASIAVIALVFGCLTWVFTALIINWLIITPAYIELYFGGDVEVFKSSCSIVPYINGDNYMAAYLLLAILPFNLLLASIVNTASYLVYSSVNKKIY